MIPKDFLSAHEIWSRSLRHEVSSPAQALGSWVPIPRESWMFAFVCVCVCVCVLVLSCVGSGRR
jgi:hypothetical protein